MKRRSLAAWVLGLAGAVAPGAAAAQNGTGQAPASGPARASAPADWIAYAGLVQASLKNWIEQSDQPAGTAIRAALQDIYPTGGEAELVVRVWADARGQVSRIQLPGAPELEPIFAELAQGRAFDQAPPADLRWPISLGLRGAPAPEPVGPDTTVEKPSQNTQ